MDLITVNNNEIQLGEQAIALMKQYVELKAQADKIEKDFKSALKAAMASNNIKSCENEYFKATYVPPSTRETFDSKKFKVDCPEIYEDYVKVSNVTDSVRMTIK